MTNLGETTVTGTSYQRAYRVYISNPRGGNPVIEFNREKIVILDGETLSKDMGSVSKMLLPETAGTEFPLRNPETGEVIPGEVSTYADVYKQIYSLFVQVVTEYDEAVAALAIPQPTP